MTGLLPGSTFKQSILATLVGSDTGVQTFCKQGVIAKGLAEERRKEVPRGRHPGGQRRQGVRKAQSWPVSSSPAHRATTASAAEEKVSAGGCGGRGEPPGVPEPDVEGQPPAVLGGLGERRSWFLERQPLGKVRLTES